MASHEHRLKGNPSQAAASTVSTAAAPPTKVRIEERDAAVVRFAGDASDGMQMVGAQFTLASTHHGNAVCTLPDHPAEIRAPAGTLAGVSAVQVHFSKYPVQTPGDRLHALIAMNPAALRAHLGDLEPGGVLIVNSDAFVPQEWEKAGYGCNPINEAARQGYRVAAVPMNQLNREAIASVKLSPREAERCRGFFTLGLAFWLFERPLEPTARWIRETYAKNPAMVEANTRTLHAGYQYGESCGMLSVRYRVGKAALPAGRYRQVSGIDALALGILTAAERSGLQVVFAGFPQAPASELLHRMFEWKQPNVTVMQAEDDLAAINIALGASFGGALGVTATSGPGLSLQTETLGLAVMSELPCVIIDVQRAGPSTGMPSKTEQADLLQALYGRHGESPLIVLAVATPADGFATIHEAARLAIRTMSPVIVLADAYLAQCTETWAVPDLQSLPAIDVVRAASAVQGTFLPYQRNANLARPWAIPGTPGLEHRTGGMEKDALTGNVSYDPLNHERMTRARREKIAHVAAELPALAVEGPAEGILVLGWGSTCGAISAAARRCRARGLPVANAHLRHLHPLPQNVGEVVKRYRKVLVPEMNAGQLAPALRSQFPVEFVSLSKMQGRQFLVSEIEEFVVAHSTRGR